MKVLDLDIRRLIYCYFRGSGGHVIFDLVDQEALKMLVQGIRGSSDQEIRSIPVAIITNKVGILMTFEISDK